MNLRDKELKPISKTAVFFGENEVGEMNQADEDGRHKYHAVLRIPRSNYGTGLVQGHGETPEAAVKDAIITSRTDAQEYLAGLLELEKAFIANV